MARLRQDIGDGGRLWLGAEGGVALARDWARDHRRDGTLASSAAATQIAPLIGGLVGIVLLRHGPLAADLEGGVRLTMLSDRPPALGAGSGAAADRSATEYGTRPWLWLGVGLRYGR